MKKLLCLLALLPHTANAAIECQYHDQAVDAATVVIQITDQQVTTAAEPGWCSIIGTVRRSFRGDTALGSSITTETPCDNEPFPPGPQIVTDMSALISAPVIELHLSYGEVASHGAGLAVLPALTDAIARTPMCDG
jgi:hypothetical protein